MHCLVVYAHPNPASFCHALKDAVVETLVAQQRSVVVRDLYQLGFQPVLSGDDFAAFQAGNLPVDIGVEQEQVAAAELIVFIYPVWWAGLPAMLKGYIDRVYAHGFAYRVEAGQVIPLLGDKRVVLISTTGNSTEAYTANGMLAAMQKTADQGIFQFCGMEVTEHLFLGAVPYVDTATREAMLAEVKELLQRT